MLEEGISIIFTVSLGSSITLFSSILSSTAQASRASRSSESKEELISLKLKNSSKVNLLSKKDDILCKHCKRTASNGVRCLGMCVADNDY